MLFSESFSMTLTGSSTTGLSVSLAPSFVKSNANVDDYLHDSYTVNAGTTASPISLGKISTAKYVFAICNKPLTIILTQDATDRSIDVTDCLIVNGDFTEIKVTNEGTEDASLTLLVAGMRIANPGTPGIYSI